MKLYLYSPYKLNLQSPAGSKLYLIENICGQVIDGFVIRALNLLTNTIIILMIILLLLIKFPAAALATIIFVCLSMYLQNKFFKSKTHKISQIMDKRYKNYKNSLLENINNIKEIKILSSEKIFYNNFYKNSSDLKAVQINYNFYSAIPPYIVEILVVSSLLVMACILSLNHSGSNSDLVASFAIVVAALFRIAPALNRVQTSIININSSKEFVKRLNEEYEQYDLEHFKEPADKQSIIHALATHKAYYHSFYHDGIEYALSASPLELKHWSIMSLDKPEIYRAPVFSAVKDLVSALSAVFFVSLVIGVVIYTMMRNNYRKQLAATYYDPVTGGYNLRKFLQRLEPRIQSKFPQTLVCFDIKDFRYINDYAGRENANALLKLVHENLSINQRVLLCCREQADHFFALLNLDDEAEINKCLNEIFNKVDSEYEKIFNLFPVIFYAGAVVMHGESLAELERRIRFMQREITPSYTHNVYFYDENTIFIML